MQAIISEDVRMNSDTRFRNGRPPRVLYLIHWMNRGGIECSLLTLLQRLDRSRYEIDIAFKGPRAGELAHDAQDTGAQLHHCPLGPAIFPFVRRLRKLLRIGKYDLLHVHTDAHAGPAVWAAREAGVPVITSFHNTSHPPEVWWTRRPLIRALRAQYAKWSMRYAMANSDLVTGVSRAVITAVENLVRLQRSDFRVLYAGIVEPRTLTAYEKAQYRYALGVPERSPIVLHVGSFSERKNHMGLLNIFRKVVDEQPDAMLLLVGDGLLRGAICKAIDELGLTGKVMLLGVRNDVTSVMQISDVLVFPSITEGLGWVLVEAGATRLPIVASDIPSIREATNNGAAAQLHRLDDIGEMANSTVRFLRNPASGNHLVENGRLFYERTFTADASVDRLLTLYDDLLGVPGRIGAPTRMIA